MTRQNLETCFLKTYPISLPVEACFCHKNENNFFISEYGPRIFDHPAFETFWTSQDVVIVGDEKTSQYYLVGAVTAFRSFTYFLVHRHQGRFNNITAYQPEIDKGQKPEEIIELSGSDWRQLLIEYAQIAAKKMGARTFDTSKNVTGYCSWYYYYFNPTEKQFFEAITAISKNRDLYNARYAQIDDGYQAAYGDWLSRNNNWPHPLADTVKKVNNLGFEAGIWTMPFLADTESQVFKNHPDWFVKDDKGNAWYIRGWGIEPHQYWACLDLSRPDVQNHIKNVYETLYEWGFRYFKFDGGGFSAPSGRRFKEDATGVSCLREGLQIIRKAVKDSIILGCGIPYLPSIGLVDHTRVSTDTGEAWHMWGLPGQPAENVNESSPNPLGMPGLNQALRGTVSNWWMFDRWFRADPDVIMARDEHSDLTIGQARMSVLSGILTGISITSDRLDKISQERIMLLQQAEKIRMKNIKPLEYKDGAWPKEWLNVFGGSVDGVYAAAIFNYSRKPRNWTLAQLGFENNVAQEILHPLGNMKDFVEVQPHDAILLVSTIK